ncbi:hypothetical protein [Streptomyces sp. NPDC047009]|uniref:hypothetical protein n=1 Tax=unclassified Streptomyces TaxID=2593676 RepID=UPI0033DDA285
MHSSISRRTGTGDPGFPVGTRGVTNRPLAAPSTGRTARDEFPGTAPCHGALFDAAAALGEIAIPTKRVTGLTLGLVGFRRNSQVAA